MYLNQPLNAEEHSIFLRLKSMIIVGCLEMRKTEFSISMQIILLHLSGFKKKLRNNLYRYMS